MLELELGSRRSMPRVTVISEGSLGFAQSCSRSIGVSQRGAVSRDSCMGVVLVGGEVRRLVRGTHHVYRRRP